MTFENRLKRLERSVDLPDEKFPCPFIWFEDKDHPETSAPSGGGACRCGNLTPSRETCKDCHRDRIIFKEFE